MQFPLSRIYPAPQIYIIFFNSLIIIHPMGFVKKNGKTSTGKIPAKNMP
jgi:hypothetical protein